jgi:hypothetical protein
MGPCGRLLPLDEQPISSSPGSSASSPPSGSEGHLHHPLDEEAAHLRLVDDVGEQVADLVDLGEARQDRAEALVLAPRLLQVDDVVVEELLAVGRGDREELGPGVWQITVRSAPISEVTRTRATSAAAWGRS